MPSDPVALKMRPTYIISALMLAASLAFGAAPSLPWLDDLASASKAASESARPLFAVALPAESFDSLRRGLDDCPAFVRAAAGCPLVRVDSTSQAYAKAFAVDSAVPVAVIASPSGKVESAYSELPSPDALAADLLSARARVFLSAAQEAASARDELRAIASLRSALDLNPPYPEAAAARLALTGASERGRAKIATLDALFAERRFTDVRAALRKIAADYAGSDAALAASARIDEMARDPLIQEALKLHDLESAAKALLDQARAAEADERFLDAATLYRKVTEQYPKTAAAAKASDNYNRVRKKAEDEEIAYVRKLQSDCRMWMSLADNYAAVGSVNKAVEYYKRIIDTYPNTAFAQAAAEKLKKLQ